MVLGGVLARGGAFLMKNGGAHLLTSLASRIGPKIMSGISGLFG